MREKLRVRQVVVVEGRYDATALAEQIDGLILTTGGFSIFTDEERKALIRRLGRQRGILIMTDSDAAGFHIRHYVEKIAAGCQVLHAYIPAVPGKERRKPAPGKEGLLGVEGLPPEALREAIARSGAAVDVAPDGSRGESEPITPTLLYELGLSGTAGSAGRRRALLQRAGLPPRLSTKALCAVLSSLYTPGEVAALAAEARAESEDEAKAMPAAKGAASAEGRENPRTGGEKPALFWDFHGTLTLPDITWFNVALEAAAERAPHRAIPREALLRHLSGTCLPWFTEPGRDTRHVAGSARWWAHVAREFTAMFQKCGLSPDEAAGAAGLVREKSLQPHRYQLYPDAAPTLAELKRRGYRSFVLSNNFPELPALVDALGLGGLFEAVITSGEVGYDKPRPEIFALAKKLAGGGPKPWMIGDNPADDIAGGHENGFVAVAVHGLRSPQASHAVDELAELLELLP